MKRGALSRPKIFEIPDNKDPVPDADIDKVETRLKETTSRKRTGLKRMRTRHLKPTLVEMNVLLML